MSTIVFGCSITHGHGLDNPNDKWPALLFDEYVDYSRPGASNKEIWHKIKQHNFNSNDLVVIQWSFVNRSCIIDSDNTITDLDCWGTNNKNEIWINFIARASNGHDLGISNLAFVESIYFQLQNTCKIINLVIDERLSKVMKHIDHINASDAIKMDVGNDGLHPGILSHKEIANLVRKRLYE
jgi:hypothetical protein